ncbi:MAG TPA: hypothetical protein VJA22_01665 [Patescibacteria group bacterium]|nr:hypothetical protein [Patescibacteria group bacterium]
MAKGQEMLCVGSKVKAYIKSKGFMTSSDVLEGLNAKMHMVLDEAMKRTESNRRSTVRSADL